MVSHLNVIVAFILSLITILVLSKRSITLGVFVGALVLGLLTLPPKEFLKNLIIGLSNVNNLLLALAVGIIPIIGELLSESGLLDSMIQNFKLGRKPLLVFSPAILGLLPMPGGALFSAPMVDKAGPEVKRERKASINVWFRHILHLIYPLAPALIIACGIAGLQMYDVILFLFPFFLVSMFLGVLLLLSKIGDDKTSENKDVDWVKFITPLLIILLAPIVDLILRTAYGITSLATLIGVSVSLVLGMLVSRMNISSLIRVVRKAKPWDFFFLIVAIYVYQVLFSNSGVPELVKNINIPMWFLVVFLSFIFGFLTGRVTTPLIILMPIYMVKFGNFSPMILALMYYSTILGYIISPIHPCLVFTAEYFKTDTREVIRDLIIVDISSLVFGVVIFLLLILLW